MSFPRLVWRGVCHYWRLYLSMGLGFVLTASLICGSLILGSSVHAGLKEEALAQLGPIQTAVIRESGHFRASLANEMQGDIDAPLEALLLQDAVAQDSRERFAPTAVTLLGIEDSFPGIDSPLKAGEVLLNQQASERMSLRKGDELIVRVSVQKGPQGERPMARPDDAIQAIRLKVAGVKKERSHFDFSIHRSVPQTSNLWVNRSWLAQKLGYSDVANLMVVLGAVEPGSFTRSIQDHWMLEDMGLETIAVGDELQLESEEVILSDDVVRAQRTLKLGQREVFSCFVFEFQSGKDQSPYGFVSAISEGEGVVPHDDEIVVNQWLADDLDLRVGSTLNLVYPDFSGGALSTTRTKSLKVSGIIPMNGLGADPALMPDFPGFSGVENCRDWKPGVDFDPSKVRPKDEEYWKLHKGAPKAFVSMKTAESMGANPYGLRSAVRFDAELEEKFRAHLSQTLSPQKRGFLVLDLRSHHLAASVPANDLGQLFLGFGFLLMASALLLSGMLLRFVLLKRKEESHTLIALGWSKESVRKLLLHESLSVASMCALIGAISGLFVAKLLLAGLGSFWVRAIGSSPLGFDAQFSHGFIAFTVTLILALAMSTRLLKTIDASEDRHSAVDANRRGLALAVLSGISALILLVWGGGFSSPMGAFLTGLCVLPLGLGLVHSWLYRRVQKDHSKTLKGLSVGYIRRRPGRSLAVVTLTALGCFLVLAVGANQKDPLANAGQRSSGTGGFALFGESALSIPLNEALPPEIVPFRKKAGDDSSCLNLGSAQTPSIIGVNPELLAQRNAFSVKEGLKGKEQSVWTLLKSHEGDVLPVIGDEATLRWGLKKGLGDFIEVEGEARQKVRLKVVAMLSTNLLQGHLIVSTEVFRTLFPGESGYQLFLVDSPKTQMEATRNSLNNRYGDYGLRLEPSTRRLAQFHSVENAYLDIFHSLGSLGMILGVLGLAILVLFNVVERRGDLQVLWALGFRKNRLKRMLVGEHLILMFMGLVLGSLAAFIAIFPALHSPGEPVPYQAISISVGAIIVAGVASTWGAVQWALGKVRFSPSTGR